MRKEPFSIVSKAEHSSLTSLVANSAQLNKCNMDGTSSNEVFWSSFEVVFLLMVDDDVVVADDVVFIVAIAPSHVF